MSVDTLSSYEETLKKIDQSFTADDACRCLAKTLEVSADPDELTRGRRVFAGEPRCWEYKLCQADGAGGTLEVVDDLIYYRCPEYIRTAGIGAGPNIINSWDGILEYLNEAHDAYALNLKGDYASALVLALVSLLFVTIAGLSSDLLIVGLVGVISCIWVPFLIGVVRSDHRAISNLRPWAGK